MYSLQVKRAENLIGAFFYYFWNTSISLCLSCQKKEKEKMAYFPILHAVIDRARI